MSLMTTSEVYGSLHYTEESTTPINPNEIRMRIYKARKESGHFLKTATLIVDYKGITCIKRMSTLSSKTIRSLFVELGYRCYLRSIGDTRDPPPGNLVSEADDIGFTRKILGITSNA